MEHDPTDVPSTGAHPSASDLQAFASGGTATAVDLSEHLRTCDRCSKIVAHALGTPPVGDATRPSSTALEPPPPRDGDMVGRYRIVDTLGHGGMGVVYRAIDTELDRPVALKLVRAATAIEELTERLRRESRLQARASHPSVIAVYDIGRDGDRVYVAMELANGGTLGRWLARAPRDWRELVDVFVRAGEGLAAAHTAGLVHRDFKPDNVLVEESGNRVTRVLVTDFGVARAVEAVERRISSTALSDLNLTAEGALVGTPAYMAPEQLQGEPVDARTDVFAFAVGLWEALYGRRPYVGGSIAELIVVMDEPLRGPTSARVPSWLEGVLRRALAIDPAQRFQTMQEMLHALDRAAEQTGRCRRGAPPARARHRSVSEARRRCCQRCAGRPRDRERARYAPQGPRSRTYAGRVGDPRVVEAARVVEA